MISKTLLFFTATVIFLPEFLPASTIFTTGPDDGVVAQDAITRGYAVTEAFTLTSSVILNQVTFDDWAGPPSSNGPASIDWEITSQPNAGVLFSATGAALSNTWVNTNATFSYTIEIYNSSFRTPAIHLGPGTYWLLLDNCSPYEGCSLGESSSTGAAREYLNGVLEANNIGTESFSLSGSVVDAPTGTPEPAGTFLAGGLFLAAGLAARKRVCRLQ